MIDVVVLLQQAANDHQLRCARHTELAEAERSFEKQLLERLTAQMHSTVSLTLLEVAVAIARANEELAA